ncbi:hypothetical protein HZC31_06210 [Candidatus Woesearchaeota archaeon]|nr:hypothetical protein [Candidatus Woesearchaeota archaeon]
MNKFKKIVALDTVIFYPEHEEVLKGMVEKPKVERVPLQYNDETRQWDVPEGYTLPEDASIIIWPSSLPESFAGISTEIHERLRTAQCWTEAGLRQDLNAQNLYNRVKDADCILTCWTEIPDATLDKLIEEGKTKAIITWTHEFEHRLNVQKARDAGIYTNCVPDYGTDSVGELVFDGLVKLIERNKKTDERATKDDDYIIDVLGKLFAYYRESAMNEKNTRRGKFSHQFHKLGRAQQHYGSFGKKTLDEIIPERMLQGKNVGLVVDSFFRRDAPMGLLSYVLENGFGMRTECIQEDSNGEYIDFDIVLSNHDFMIYNSRTLLDEQYAHRASLEERKKIVAALRAKGEKAIDLAETPHYEETLRGKTIGIIGLGRIGRKVASLAASLGMDVQYAGQREYDFSDIKQTRLGSPRYVPLDQLLTTSDVVTVHVPAHKAEGLLTPERIAMMWDGTYFINTSDANAVDQIALTERMLRNEIYAALDVYQGLPTAQTIGLDPAQGTKIGNRLANHVLTYRAGWKTQESIRLKTYKLLGHMKEALRFQKIEQ